MDSSTKLKLQSLLQSAQERKASQLSLSELMTSDSLFPLELFFTLYVKHHRILYSLDGNSCRNLIQFLGPFSPSQQPTFSLPPYMYNIEIHRLASYLHLTDSQVFLHLVEAHNAIQSRSKNPESLIFLPPNSPLLSSQVPT